MQLHKTEQGVQEYAEFLHLPKKKFTDFGMLFPFSFFCLADCMSVQNCSIFVISYTFLRYNALSLVCLIFVFDCTAIVRKEIQEETDRVTGRSKQISPVPIHLSIYSPNGKARLGFCFCTQFDLSVMYVYMSIEMFSSSS